MSFSRRTVIESAAALGVCGVLGPRAVSAAVTLSGDELSIVSPVSAVGGGSVHLLLRRAR